MKEYDGFVDGPTAIKDALIELDKINFDIEKYNPVLIRFAKEGMKYVYAISKDIEVEVGDSIVVPVGGADRFSLGEVYSTIKHFDTDFIKIIKRFTIETKQQNRNVKCVALNLGNKYDGLLKPYFDNIEKDKKKNKIMERLEVAAEKANKMSRFQSLAESNPEIRKLLQELKEIK